jgi:hypothetical protein
MYDLPLNVDFDLIDTSDFDAWDDYYGQDDFELDEEVEAQRLNGLALVPWGKDFPINRIFGNPKVRDIEKAFDKPEAWLRAIKQSKEKKFDKQLDACVYAAYIMGKEAGAAQAKAESSLHMPFTKGKNSTGVMTEKEVVKHVAGQLAVCRFDYRDSLESNINGAEYHGNMLRTMNEKLTQLANDRLQALAQLETVTQTEQQLQE